MMHICDHRHRRFHTLDGPVHLICKLNHCPDPACPGHAKTKSPELEITLALPPAVSGDWVANRGTVVSEDAATSRRPAPS
jgi:hypothetical protein